MHYHVYLFTHGDHGLKHSIYATDFTKAIREARGWSPCSEHSFIFQCRSDCTPTSQLNIH